MFLANDDWTPDVAFDNVAFDDGLKRRFDVESSPACEAFESLSNLNTFKTIRDRGCFVDWTNEIDQRRHPVSERDTFVTA